LRNHIENLGKRPLEQSGKHRVNEIDEEIFAACGSVPRIITGFRHRGVWRGDRVLSPSLRANGSRECAPDDRLREAIQTADWIASSLRSSQ
jgi:hypothetical protein